MKQILLASTLALAMSGQFVAAAALPPTQPQQPALKKFVVHEWGTFTSVMGSNGLRVGGLHHEEEKLPDFIVGRDLLNENVEAYLPPGDGIPSTGGQNCYPSKGLPVCDDVRPTPLMPAPTPAYKITPEVVTQKMETPVIYFYSDEKVQSRVTVDFPKGIISQYYPAPLYFAPATGKIQRLSGGKTVFEVEVTTEKLKLPVVEHGNVYAPAREVASNDIRSGQQNERFIFYRGLGDFSTNLSITSSIDNGLSLRNRGLKISNVILLDVTSTTGAVKSLGSLEADASLQLNNKDLTYFREAQKLPRAEFEAQAEKIIVQALIASGLYPDESLAMFNTWKTSYLKSKGLRALYILSRLETDEILPIKVSPTPTELVRTLAGRIEILLHSEEQQLMKDLRAGKYPLFTADDRFAEPKLRRMLTLAHVGETSKIYKMIDDLNP